METENTQVNEETNSQVEETKVETTNENNHAESKEEKGEAGKENTETNGELKAESSKEEIKYDLSLEGLERLKEDDVNALKEFAKQHDLTNEQAKALLNEKNTLLQSVQDELQKAKEDNFKAMEKEALDDPAIGGEKLESNLKLAKLGAEKIGIEGLTEYLDASGLGSNKFIIKTFMQIGEWVSNDSLEMGGKTQGTAKTKAQILYGN